MDKEAKFQVEHERVRKWMEYTIFTETYRPELSTIKFKPMGQELIISILSLAVSTAQLGMDLKDRFQKAVKNRKDLTDSVDVAAEIMNLQALVPQGILDSFFKRVQRCFDLYGNALDDKQFLPGENDEATDAVMSCVCRELNRSLKVNGSIPEGVLRRYWKLYQCKTKN